MRINTSRRVLVLNRPFIMGVLNITPDSFSDGGKYLNPESAVKRAFQMVEEGADIIDIGAESTRPGSKPISEKEELERLLPVLKILIRQIDIPLSVDTSKWQVAKICYEEGVEIINDVSGLRDEGMLKFASESDAAFIAMHMRGKPEFMHHLPPSEDIVEEVDSFFEGIVSKEFLKGRLILDPGIGFGKNREENFKLLRNIKKFKRFGVPILVGASRKSFIGDFLNREVSKRLPGTIGVNLFATLMGADILRVHDVWENGDALRIFYKLLKEDS